MNSSRPFTQEMYNASGHGYLHQDFVATEHFWANLPPDNLWHLAKFVEKLTIFGAKLFELYALH